MEQKEIKALIKRIDWSVTAIEKKLGISQGTLAKAAKGERGLKEQWHTPLRALADIRRFEKQPHLKNFVKAKYSEKDLVPVVPVKYDNVISEIDPTAGDIQVVNQRLHDEVFKSTVFPDTPNSADKLFWAIPYDKKQELPTLERQEIKYVPCPDKSESEQGHTPSVNADEIHDQLKDFRVRKVAAEVDALMPILSFCSVHSCTPQDLIDAYNEKHQPIPRPSQDLLDLLP
jgi:transcriptional regulator with XRE-family HTH domain